MVSAAAGSAHTVVLSDGGLVFGCGLDSKGQVGGVTFEGESDKDKDKDKANKYDRHAVLCPRPIEIPPVPPTHRGPGADTSSPRHSTLLTPTATSSSSSASSAAATKGGVDTTVRGSVGTVLVSQISCGDFHSAAITQSQRLYVWGACQLDSGAAPARSGAGKVGDKVDVTPILGGVPKKVRVRSCGRHKASGERETLTPFTPSLSLSLFVVAQVGCSAGFTLVTIA